MRNTSRLALSALALGGSLALAGPVAAQEACPYPFDPADPRCSEGPPPQGECPYPFDPADPRCAEVESSVSDQVPDAPSEAADDASTLPFTGGEVAALSLVGAGALAGGVALVTVARKRKTA